MANEWNHDSYQKQQQNSYGGESYTNFEEQMNNSFNGYDAGEFTKAAYEAQTRESLSTYTAKTYLWMFAGLLVTFLVSVAIGYTGAWYSLIQVPGIMIAVLIAELAVVILMSAMIRKMSPAAAAACFFTYAALTGVTFSLYFIVYDLYSMILVFVATAMFFGLLAGAALIFKLQLDSIRPFLFGGLILLIVFGLLSMFMGLGAFDTVICYLGIAVFLGYTAYDTAKIRDYYAYYQSDAAMLKKASIFSALQLYLDFVNLFLYILRLLGRKK